MGGLSRSRDRRGDTASSSYVLEVVPIVAVEHIGTGPFSGEASGNMKAEIITHGRSYGVITSESDAAILKALLVLKAASRNQLIELLSLSGHSLKKSIPRLCRLGFIDRIETGKTPPLYMLGPEGRALLKQRPEEWHILKAFRIAAANQLYMKLRNVWSDMEYRVEPHQGLTASISVGDTEFGVIAPRVWPGETNWARDLADLAPDDVRLLLICGSRTMAEECSRVIKSARPIRYSWDGLLRDEVRFYKKSGNGLASAETIFSEKNVLTRKASVV